MIKGGGKGSEGESDFTFPGLNGGAPVHRT